MRFIKFFLQFLFFLPILFGTSIIIFSGVRMWDTREEIQQYAKTEGVVIGNDVRRGGYRRSSKIYTPIVEFTLPSGEKISDAARSGNNLKTYEVGEHIPIYYDPVHPESWYVDSIVFLYGFHLVLCLFGLFFITIPFTVRRSLRRNNIISMFVPLMNKKKNTQF